METAMIAKTPFFGTLIAIFCIFEPVAAWAQHDILKAGGVDDEGVAEAYYATIDPDNLRTTQSDWEEENGFNDPVNEVVVAKGYFNEGDLSFFRSIHMVEDKRRGYRGNVAFTTVNYRSESDALAEINKVSVVNMEYSEGPEEDHLSKFYVFSPDGARQNGTAFVPGDPGEAGETLYLPAACYSCHGGDDDAESPMPSEGYNEGSGETNATFLAFDIHTMRFDNTSQASLEPAFKQMNKAILHTDPTKATRALIKGLYGGSRLPRATQVPDYIPASWESEAELYRDVVVPSCRSCHTTSDTKVLSLEWWKDNPDKIRDSVFDEMTMPNSQPTFQRFWASSQPWILEEALDRFEND
jgi:hypothetical protein